MRILRCSARRVRTGVYRDHIWICASQEGEKKIVSTDATVLP